MDFGCLSSTNCNVTSEEDLQPSRAVSCFSTSEASSTEKYGPLLTSVNLPVAKSYIDENTLNLPIFPKLYASPKEPRGSSSRLTSQPTTVQKAISRSFAFPKDQSANPANRKQLNYSKGEDQEITRPVSSICVKLPSICRLESTTHRPKRGLDYRFSKVTPTSEITELEVDISSGSLRRHSLSEEYLCWPPAGTSQSASAPHATQGVDENEPIASTSFFYEKAGIRIEHPPSPIGRPFYPATSHTGINQIAGTVSPTPRRTGDLQKRNLKLVHLEAPSASQASTSVIPTDSDKPMVEKEALGSISYDIMSSTLHKKHKHHSTSRSQGKKKRAETEKQPTVSRKKHLNPLKVTNGKSYSKPVSAQRHHQPFQPTPNDKKRNKLSNRKSAGESRPDSVSVTGGAETSSLKIEKRHNFTLLDVPKPRPSVGLDGRAKDQTAHTSLTNEASMKSDLRLTNIGKPKTIQPVNDGRNIRGKPLGERPMAKTAEVDQSRKQVQVTPTGKTETVSRKEIKVLQKPLREVNKLPEIDNKSKVTYLQEPSVIKEDRPKQVVTTTEVPRKALISSSIKESKPKPEPNVPIRVYPDENKRVETKKREPKGEKLAKQDVTKAMDKPTVSSDLRIIAGKEPLGRQNQTFGRTNNKKDVIVPELPQEAEPELSATPKLSEIEIIKESGEQEVKDLKTSPQSMTNVEIKDHDSTKEVPASPVEISKVEQSKKSHRNPFKALSAGASKSKKKKDKITEPVLDPPPTLGEREIAKESGEQEVKDLKTSPQSMTIDEIKDYDSTKEVLSSPVEMSKVEQSKKDSKTSPQVFKSNEIRERDLTMETPTSPVIPFKAEKPKKTHGNLFQALIAGTSKTKKGIIDEPTLKNYPKLSEKKIAKDSGEQYMKDTNTNPQTMLNDDIKKYDLKKEVSVSSVIPSKAEKPKKAHGNLFQALTVGTSKAKKKEKIDQPLFDHLLKLNEREIVRESGEQKDNETTTSQKVLEIDENKDQDSTKDLLSSTVEPSNVDREKKNQGNFFQALKAGTNETKNKGKVVEPVLERPPKLSEEEIIKQSGEKEMKDEKTSPTIFERDEIKEQDSTKDVPSSPSVLSNADKNKKDRGSLFQALKAGMSKSKKKGNIVEPVLDHPPKLSERDIVKESGEQEVYDAKTSPQAMLNDDIREHDSKKEVLPSPVVPSKIEKPKKVHGNLFQTLSTGTSKSKKTEKIPEPVLDHPPKLSETEIVKDSVEQEDKEAKTSPRVIGTDVTKECDVSKNVPTGSELPPNTSDQKKEVHDKAPEVVITHASKIKKNDKIIEQQLENSPSLGERGIVKPTEEHYEKDRNSSPKAMTTDEDGKFDISKDVPISTEMTANEGKQKKVHRNLFEVMTARSSKTKKKETAFKDLSADGAQMGEDVEIPVKSKRDHKPALKKFRAETKPVNETTEKADKHSDELQQVDHSTPEIKSIKFAELHEPDEVITEYRHRSLYFAYAEERKAETMTATLEEVDKGTAKEETKLQKEVDKPPEIQSIVKPNEVRKKVIEQINTHVMPRPVPTDTVGQSSPPTKKVSPLKSTTFSPKARSGTMIHIPAAPGKTNASGGRTSILVKTDQFTPRESLFGVSSQTSSLGDSLVQHHVTEDPETEEINQLVSESEPVESYRNSLNAEFKPANPSAFRVSRYRASSVFLRSSLFVASTYADDSSEDEFKDVFQCDKTYALPPY